MTDSSISTLFAGLTTPHVADACLKKGVEVRCAPPAVRPLTASNCRIAGKAVPVRHYGSVDIFLEAMENAQSGDVLVIDNSGRQDEACIGDLVALEAKKAGFSGIVVWGLHRDTLEIIEIDLPVFSLGALPTGPLRLDQREPDALISAKVGPWTVTAGDVVLGDENGLIFFPIKHAEEIASAALSIRSTELSQANKMKNGVSLRNQLQFGDFLSSRSTNRSLTFRQHLRRIGGAIEE